MLWPKFVIASFDICKSNGYVCLIHPGLWRIPSKIASSCQKVLFSKKILYLELHSLEDGLRIFNCNTSYDWYIANNGYKSEYIIIRDYEGKITQLSTDCLFFISNSHIKEVLSYMTVKLEDRINMLRGKGYNVCSKHIGRQKNHEYKYPIVYSLTQKEIRLLYSTLNTNGHFGIPKVIFSSGYSSQVIVDKDGEYGMTQFANAIIDKLENLENIQKVMSSKKFIQLCSYFRMSYDRYDYRCIAFLKKDFWKEFVD